MPSKRGDGPYSTANAELLVVLGIRVQGDIGPWTVYTDRDGRLKFFLYSPPTKEPTPNQIHARNRFQTAQANWKALTVDEKKNLEDATNAGSLCMTGQNVFISAQMKHMNHSLQALGRQTGITLPTAPVV